MGLSGSGKSTLVRHINRLLEPTSGKILINNQDVMQFNKKNLQELRNKKIGMVFQNFALMPHRSVLDNIAMPLEIRGISKNDRIDVANKILSVVELQGWGNKYAHELSGGMQQRVGLARALAADPEFLLMDEPFSALDPLIRRQLQTEFIKLSKQMINTVVFFICLESLINSVCNCLLINGSSALKGSSISRNSGSAAKALANPTLCCIPPDNSCAYLFPHPCNSTTLKILLATSILSFLLIPLISRGIAILSRTERWGINAKF
jgi:ABC-type methionine transport system ATPase subunit